MNITDIDDKIMSKAHSLNTSPIQIARFELLTFLKLVPMCYK